jgi:chromosome segregation ATPase
MWIKSKHGGAKSLQISVLVLFVCLSVCAWAQESMESLPEAQYMISETDRQQLMQILQNLSDKIRKAQSDLTVSEQALQESKAQLQITQAQYDSSMAQLRALQAAWEQLSSELDGLKQDKTRLQGDLASLQTAYQILDRSYQDLAAASAKLTSEYIALQTAYQAQTQTLTALQKSLDTYKKSVQNQKTKSIIFEVILFFVAAGWSLDALGVF